MVRLLKYLKDELQQMDTLGEKLITLVTRYNLN